MPSGRRGRSAQKRPAAEADVEEAERSPTRPRSENEDNSNEVGDSNVMYTKCTLGPICTPVDEAPPMKDDLTEPQTKKGQELDTNVGC